MIKKKIQEGTGRKEERKRENLAMATADQVFTYI